MKNVVTIQRNQANLNVKNLFKKNVLFRLYENMLMEYSSGAYAYGTLGILGQSCYASITAMFVLMNPNNISKPTQMIQLFLVTIFCIGFNAMVISQQKPKIQMNVLIISVLISTVFLLSNAF